MDKLKMHSPDVSQQNVARIRDLFPVCVTEAMGKDGKVQLTVDFDLLRQELSGAIVEGPQERYQLNWPGKRDALLTANAPIAKTLRPCRDESVSFDTTKNLFIEGDNLDALKLLQESYLGKVKMIYIDPPYNTGNDFIYADDFAENANQFLIKSHQKDEQKNRLLANMDTNGRFHSAWLSMMYSRLKLGRNLLRDDGVIFISIDDSEVSSLLHICNDIYGRENFISNFMWLHGKGKKDKNVRVLQQYILGFAKNKEALSPWSESKDAQGKMDNPDNDPRGLWFSGSVSFSEERSNKQNKNFYVIRSPSGVTWERQWQIPKEEMDKFLKDGKIWFGKPPEYNAVPRIKIYKDEKVEVIPGNIIDSVGTTRSANGELERILTCKVFDNPKPAALIQHLMVISQSDIHALILDFFAGSSTTAHAVMQLNAEDGGNRQFIMVQLPEQCDDKTEALKAGYHTIADISKERVRRVGKEIVSGETHTDWNKDTGFRVLKIDTSNMADVHYTPDHATQAQTTYITSHIKPDRTPEDLLFQVLLDWGVDITLPISKEIIYPQIAQMDADGESQKNNLRKSAQSADKKSFEVFIDTNALVACFDLEINESLITELAKRQPLRAVFRDDGFKDDSTKINAEQIFKQLSPTTDVKVI